MKLFLFLKGIMNSIRSRILDWWRGRPTFWKFILGIGAAVSVINEVINLYKNINMCSITSAVHMMNIAMFDYT